MTQQPFTHNDYSTHDTTGRLVDAVLRECHPRTAQRAFTILQDGNAISSRKCRRSGDDTILTAFVVSSSGWADTYRVSVALNESTAELVDYACTCPASYQFDGPCKHCTALVLTFCYDPSSFDGFAESRRTSTSPELAEYLHRAEQAMTLENPGSVDFDITLSHAYGQWSARFKIRGPQGSYVLKDLGDFLERMREGSYHSYGKKLAFSHVEEAFTPQGKAVVKFLSQADDVRRESSKTVWYASLPGLRGRDIVLADDELMALVDIVAKSDMPEVQVEADDAYGRRKSVAPIIDGNPPLSLSVEQKTDGFVVARSQAAQIFTSDTGVLIWTDEAFYRCTASLLPHAEILQAIFESNADTLFISDTDMPLFCATALPAIEQVLTVNTSPEVDALRPIPCQLEFYLDKTPHHVTCEAVAVYGERRYNLLDDSGQEKNDSIKLPAPLRDTRVESKGRSLLRTYFSVETVEDTHGTHTQARISASGDETLAKLLFEGLERLRNAGTVFTTPAFDRLITERKPKVSMGVSLAGNLINLTVSASDLPADELSALLGSYHKRKRYHRLKNGAFLDIADLDLAQLDSIVSDLDISSSQLASGKIELPTYRAFYLDDALENAQRDASFSHYVDNFRKATQKRHQLPQDLKAKLRPYQEDGFQWLSTLADMDFGGVLADEMGLGKTVQIIAFLLARKDQAHACGPNLIVCPASLVYNWIAELTRFAPTLKAVAVAGPKRERTLSRSISDVDVFVTSYDLARIDIEEWSSISLFCCVLDEAQYIKNHGTLTAKAVKRLNARHRFALTGTPMENRLSEIWSIFDFVMPGFLGSYARFKERFELDIVGGDQDAAQRLASLVGPFMLRRLKRDVLTDLPDKIESVVPVPLSPKQQRLYNAHEQKLREDLTAQRKYRKANSQLPPEVRKPPVEVLAELTRLRELCCDPRLIYEDYKGEGAKLDAICDLIQTASDSGQKVLVFSQFTSFLDLISQRLDNLAVLYYTITGATPKQRRVALADKFNEDDTPVFLISLKAGGTGLNLTGASVVIHADPWWNAAAQNQATDRAHRIGQKRSVSVYRVIAQDTIEERIVRLQDQKSELADTIVGAEGASLANLTEEDLLELLQGA